MVLEDRSVWLVGPEKFKTALWLPATNVLACPGELVSLTDGDVAGATRVR